MTVIDALPLVIGLVWCLLIAGFVWRVNRSAKLSPPAAAPLARGGLVLTPAEFRRDVLPSLHAAWESACFCNSEAFKRLTSFEMSSAAALADAQIVITEIIRKEFSTDGIVEDRSLEQAQRYACPRCGSACQVCYEQFSINMDRQYVIWGSAPAPSAQALFVIGFYGFAPPSQVTGFKRASSIDQFVASLTRGEALPADTLS